MDPTSRRNPLRRFALRIMASVFGSPVRWFRRVPIGDRDAGGVDDELAITTTEGLAGDGADRRQLAGRRIGSDRRQDDELA